MKTSITKGIGLRCWAAFVLVVCWAQIASAYYDPGEQRWLNRDPRAERGFKVCKRISGGSRIQKPQFGDLGWKGEQNLYLHCANAPVAAIDPYGLKFTQWGNYCGNDFCGGKNLKSGEKCDFTVPAKDGIDSCCKEHDECYDKCNDGEDKTKKEKCDTSFCECLNNWMDEHADEVTAQQRIYWNKAYVFFECERRLKK